MRKNKILALISLLLISVLCLSSCGGNSTPKAKDANGTIEGTNITWKFTSSDNTLEISGSGEIPSKKSSEEFPWADVLQSVITLEIEDGIEKIGDKAFYGATNLKNLDLGKDVSAIGELAFAYTALEELDLEDNSLKTIGKAAFEGCTKLVTVNTGDVLESLGERAFAFCSSLSSVKIPTAIKLEAETFYNCKALAEVFRNPALDGYTVDESAFKGTDFDFVNASKEYSKEKVKVTVNFVFEDGSKETETKTKECTIGESYTFAVPTYEGYKADITDANITGVAKSSVEEYVKTVTYKKVEVETAPETTDVLVEPEEPNYVSLVIMIVVVAGVIVGAFFLMKSNKKEEQKAKNQNKAKNRKQK